MGNIPHHDMFLQTYDQYLAIENTIYVHTIYVSYLVQYVFRGLTRVQM
jgi:hypothetical protein